MSAHFSRGSKNEFAFVLSCPGRLEERARHPAAGVTGKNLNRLLAMLGPRLDLKSFERADVTITNAWDGIEYPKKTRRSEATDAEVKQADNLRRLASELLHVTELVVFCGCKAKLASQELLRLGILPNLKRVAFVEHLGTQGLLTIKSDTTGNPIVAAEVQLLSGRADRLPVIQSENTNRRLSVVLQRLLASTQSVS
jgi:hypothetical protein